MKYGKNNKFRTFFFYCVMVFLVVLGIELLSQVTFLIIFGKRYSPANLRSYVVHKYDMTDQSANFLKQEVIHPYVGYVSDFGDEKKNFTSQGFSNAFSPVVKREAGKVNIVILGGSVANSASEYIEQAWKKTFKATPRIINLALPGFKEPQQLMALTYFLALGAQYDLVINLDGFNDIVLPYVENYVAGVNPWFPRSWEIRISDNPPPQVLATIGKVKYFQDIKRERLAALATSGFNFSATYGLIKMVQLMMNNKDIYKSSMALLKLQMKSKKRFAESGPVEHFANDTKMFEAAADFWYRCSLLINDLASKNGFAYYHFLQPDQYLEGSKQLSKEEKRFAFNPKHVYRRPVVIGYPLLIARGKMLVKDHVNFFDATMIFAHTKETVYSDDACHFNKRGYQLVADYIMQAISRHSKFERLRPAGALPN